MSDQQPTQRRVIKDLPLTRLIPNTLTLMSLSSGLTGIRFALQDRWEPAVLAIIIAAIFDVLDGRVARMLGLTSKFGAELDSLSDVISFGVAPGFIMYAWVLSSTGGIGWVAVLIFAVCMALRLARFNTMLEDHTLPAWTKRFFTGVPAPAGASLALLPLVFWLEFGDGMRLPGVACALWMILVAGLLVSRLPTFALKGWRVAPVWIAPIMVLVGLVAAGLASDTWLTFSVLGSLYVLALPAGWYSYQLRARKEATEYGQAH